MTADQSPDLHLQKEGKLNNLLPNFNCLVWPLQNLFTAYFAGFELFGELVLYICIKILNTKFLKLVFLIQYQLIFLLEIFSHVKMIIIKMCLVLCFLNYIISC